MTDATIKSAMILGAGKGTRMRELTADRPKPMIPVAGRPLIDHVLHRLIAHGVTDVVANAHYKADVLEAHLASHSEPRIMISDERDELLDTGGGVYKALHHFGDDVFFIHNSDSIWHETGTPALAILNKAWDPARMDSLLLLADPSDSLGYDGPGDFAISAEGTLQRRTDTHDKAFVFAGVSIAHPRLFADAPEGVFSLNVLWNQAITAGRLYGVLLEGRWMHVGTPEAVEEANAYLAPTSREAR